MTPKASKELKRVLWIFVGSFFLTPLLLWFVIVDILKHDFSFREDYLDFYRDLFSLKPDMVFAWLILFVPVLLYELAVTCRYYYRHPQEMRSILKFPGKGKR
jgi:hypothetical protein